MLKETGKIVAIDKDALWVETLQGSVCGSCAAQKGCGQSLLGRLGASPSYLRVLLDGRTADSYRIGQNIDIGIPADVVTKSSLLAYMLPVICSLVFALSAHTYVGNELLNLLFAVIGFSVGGFAVSFHAKRYRNDPDYQPVIVEVVDGKFPYERSIPEAKPLDWQN